ncbi:methyl-accepting chemotaxis protein [Thaumasiovibrio sp. DFM-14]|uniref:methyl-accepting chemotaxis protein n=1 Tax=Thaumasiovibrio sp. DFM-14 TaxID=3384792 RepID=UPI0039A25BE4
MRLLSVQWKIIAVAGLGLLFTVAALQGVGHYYNRITQAEISQQSYLTVTAKTEELVYAQAAGQAVELRRILDEADSRAQMMAQSILFLKYNAEINYISSADLRASISELLSRTVADFPTVDGAYVVFEPNGLDDEDSYYINADYAGSNDAGRFATRWDRVNGEPQFAIIPEAEIIDSPWFNCSVDSKQGCFLAPELKQGIPTATFTVPLILDQKVIGVIGLVTSLEALQPAATLASQQLVNGAGKVTIIASNGLILGSGDLAIRGKRANLQHGFPSSTLAAINQGVEHLEWTPDGLWLNMLTSVEIGQNWVGILIQLPQNAVLKDAVALDKLMTNAYSDADKVQWLAAFMVLLLALVISWVAARTLVSPIKLVVMRLKDIASGEGDLTERLEVHGRDEISELATWFNRFLDKLQPTIRQIIDSAGEIDCTANQTSRVATAAEESSASQFKEVDLAATASEQMTHTAGLVVKQTELSTTAALKALQFVDQGESVVNLSANAMHQLVERMEAAVPIAHELAQGSDSINQILSVIEGVSEQTNLLALNAAIEAARAGEHGRGFAVVADEVRQLARRTQESVGQIREVIEQIHTGTNRVVEAIEEGNSAATDTAVQVQKTVASLEAITVAVSEIQVVSEEITRAADEQQTASAEMSSNVRNIRLSSKQILQQAEETTQVSQHLTKLAEQQRQLVGQFRV